MDITMFLARIWGPAMLAMGIGIFMSPEYYIRVYRDLQKETLAVLTFGLAAIAAGIAQIFTHNIWGTLPQMIISLMGWMLMIKGFALTILPQLVDKSGDWTADKNLIPYGGFVLIVLGFYLSWIGFLS